MTECEVCGGGCQSSDAESSCNDVSDIAPVSRLISHHSPAYNSRLRQVLISNVSEKVFKIEHLTD